MCKIDELSKKEVLELSKKYKNISDIFEFLSLNSKYSTCYYRKWNAKCKILGIDSKALFIKSEKDKRSKIDNQTLIECCKNNTSASDVFKNLGLNIAGSNFRWINKKIKELNINTYHWKEAKKNVANKIPLKEILVENSVYLHTSFLKKRLIKEKLLEYKCYECGISNWRDRELSLHLEHKNGIPNDNRIENLELLCPNCHSQTKTFAGRNIKKKIVKDICDICNVNFVSKNAKTCKECYTKSISTKIKWPPNNVLLQMVQDTNFSQAAQKLGVSDNAIRKRLKKANLI